MCDGPKTIQLPGCLWIRSQDTSRDSGRSDSSSSELLWQRAIRGGLGMSTAKLYDVWWLETPDGDAEMERRHQRHWQKIVAMILETDLSSFAVLDFGCGQGGFLRYLYGTRPFKRGVGVDLAQESVGIARSRADGLPIDYHSAGSLLPYENEFDMAISSSVLYLISDLRDHAQQVRHALRPGGVYYATYTDCARSRSLPRMRREINRHSMGRMNLHSLDQITRTFEGEGFDVGISRLPVQGYVPVSSNDRFFRRVSDRMESEYMQAYIFRFSASGQ